MQNKETETYLIEYVKKILRKGSKLGKERSVFVVFVLRLLHLAESEATTATHSLETGRAPPESGEETNPESQEAWT